jgi:hypothetical protein
VSNTKSAFMRQSFFILSFFVVTLLGCKKSVTNVDIYRQWKWENSIGGFTGIDTIMPSQNSIVTLNFKNDMTYSAELNGQIISDGTFQILTINNQKILRTNNFLPIEGLWLENNGSIIQIENNKLHLTDYEVSEPYTHNFQY